MRRTPSSGLVGAAAAPACAFLATAALFAGGARAQAPAPAAAPAPVAAAASPDDPWERTNRRFFAVNAVIDRRALRPGAVFYKHAAPRPIRTGLRHAFSNLGEPLVAVNDLLQGRFGLAGRTLVRVAVNTTFGLGGFLDVAAPGGLPHHDNGFGLTLGRYGVRSGPYVYLPLLGPSTVRDLAGGGVDAALNPFIWTRYPYDYAVGAGSSVLGGLDRRGEADGDLKALKALSTDEYASLRSFYLQNRRAEVTGRQVDVDALPDFDAPDGAAGASPGASPAAAGSVSPTPGALAHPPADIPTAPSGDAGALPAPALPPAGPPSPGPGV